MPTTSAIAVRGRWPFSGMVTVAVAVAVPLTWPLPFAMAVAVRVASTAPRRKRGTASTVFSKPLNRRRTSAAAVGLRRIAAVEDHVFHLVAAQALRALLAHHPGDGVGDVALAAAIRADDRRDALVEGQLPIDRKTI